MVKKMREEKRLKDIAAYAKAEAARILERERVDEERRLLEIEMLEQEKLERERLELEKLERERIENEKLERERLESSRVRPPHHGLSQLSHSPGVLAACSDTKVEEFKTLFFAMLGQKGVAGEIRSKLGLSDVEDEEERDVFTDNLTRELFPDYEPNKKKTKVEKPEFEKYLLSCGVAAQKLVHTASIFLRQKESPNNVSSMAVFLKEMCVTVEKDSVNQDYFQTLVPFAVELLKGDPAATRASRLRGRVIDLMSANGPKFAQVCLLKKLRF